MVGALSSRPSTSISPPSAVRQPQGARREKPPGRATRKGYREGILGSSGGRGGCPSPQAADSCAQLPAAYSSSLPRTILAHLPPPLNPRPRATTPRPCRQRGGVLSVPWPHVRDPLAHPCHGVHQGLRVLHQARPPQPPRRWRRHRCAPRPRAPSMGAPHASPLSPWRGVSAGRRQSR